MMKRAAFIVLLILVVGCGPSIAASDAETVPPQGQKSNASEVIVPVFGKGKIDVWLYSNYFCEWCKMGPDFDRMLTELVHNNVITITFIDVPISRFASPLYARYFFYSLKHRMEFDQAMRVRKALYDAAWAAIKDESKLESYLTQQGIAVTKFDTTSSLKNLNQYKKYLREQNNGKTIVPACAILNGSERKISVGASYVIRAFSAIAEDTKRQD